MYPSRSLDEWAPKSSSGITILSSSSGRIPIPVDRQRLLYDTILFLSTTTLLLTLPRDHDLDRNLALDPPSPSLEPEPRGWSCPTQASSVHFFYFSLAMFHTFTFSSRCSLESVSQNAWQTDGKGKARRRSFPFCYQSTWRSISSPLLFPFSYGLTPTSIRVFSLPGSHLHRQGETNSLDLLPRLRICLTEASSTSSGN